MFQKDLLQKKRILITGGGTGLGKGMAARFLELGATVYICGRREEVLKTTVSELGSKGPIHALPADVRSLDGWHPSTRAPFSAFRPPTHRLARPMWCLRPCPKRELKRLCAASPLSGAIAGFE